jgi:DNA-directed RNA polymerase
MNSAQLTVDRFAKTTKRTADSMGWGDTPGALAIAETYLTATAEAVRTHRASLKPREHRSEVSELSDELIAVVGLSVGISAVAQGLTFARAVHNMGLTLELECFNHGMEQWDAKRTKKIMEDIKRNWKQIGFRRKALRSLAQKAKFPWKAWSSKESARAGRWLMEAMLSCDVFTIDDHHNLAITEEALEVSNAIVEQLINRHPVYLPHKEVPAEWDSSSIQVHGFWSQLVRSYDKTTQRTIKEAIRTGRMAQVLEAVNAAQSVPYRINTSILDVVRWAYQTGLDVPGMPPRDNIPMPAMEKPWENMTKAEQIVRMKDVNTTKELNRSYLGERLVFAQDMSTVEWIGNDTFYTSMNLDYRGRVYGLPFFNFQRQDYVRSLFEFSNGEPLDESGLYWLQVHLANCGDFGKVSKKPFDDRVKWVEENWERIISVATSPKDDIWWTEADSPFMFLAACMALVDHHINPSDACRLPVSFDGSCSGLQHLGAMTRDENTAKLVNLTNLGEPQDVYQVVADLAKEVIQRDIRDPGVDNEAAGRTRDVAQRSLAYGVNRSLVKRNVMTFSYSSKVYGMSEQHLEDTMKPLEYQVLRGKYDEHPFGPDNGYFAARYLAKTIYGAIEQTVYKPAEAMGFLQDIARTMAHEGKPVVWHTPLGFPVVLNYTNHTTVRVSLTLHDKGVKKTVTPSMWRELPGINKRKAASSIAPCFVHAYDACHLMMVVLAAKDEGIRDVALVHDSFGCHPNKAGRFREIIRETFWSLYRDNDVLFDIWRESHGQLQTNWHKMPPLPHKGDYNINDILEAEYAFA